MGVYIYIYKYMDCTWTAVDSHQRLLIVTSCTPNPRLIGQSIISASFDGISSDVKGRSPLFSDKSFCFAMTTFYLRWGWLLNVNTSGVLLSGRFQVMSASRDDFFACLTWWLFLGNIQKKADVAWRKFHGSTFICIHIKNWNYATVKPVLSNHAKNSYNIIIWPPPNPLLALLCPI